MGQKKSWYATVVAAFGVTSLIVLALTPPSTVRAQSQYPLNQTFPNGQAAEVSLYNGSQTVKYAVKNCGELTALLNSFLSATQVETCGSELIKAYSEGSYPLVDTLDFMVILGGTTSWSTNSFSTDGTVSWLNGSFSVPPLFHFNNVERQYMFQGGTTNILPVSITDQVYNKDFTELETGCSSSSGAVGYFTPTGTLYNNWSGPTGGTAPGSEQYILGKTYASDMPSLPSLNPFVTSQGPEACAEEAAANGGSWHYRSELDFSGPAIPDPIATLTGPTQDHQNQNFNLTYTLPQGVQSASVNQGVGSLPLTPLDSSVKVTSFPTTTTYTLTVSAIADPTVTNSPVVTVVKTDTVHIYNPTVTKFWYTTNPTNYPAYIGGQVILNWITTDASNITITDPTNKTITTATTNTGSVTIPTPAQSTTYTLVASNVEGQTKATANVAPTYADLSPIVDNTATAVMRTPSGTITFQSLPGNYGTDSSFVALRGVKIKNVGQVPAGGTAYFQLEMNPPRGSEAGDEYFCWNNQSITTIAPGAAVVLKDINCSDIGQITALETGVLNQTSLQFSFVLDAVMNNGYNVETGSTADVTKTHQDNDIDDVGPALITWATDKVTVLSKDSKTPVPMAKVIISYVKNAKKTQLYQGNSDDGGDIAFIPLLSVQSPPLTYTIDVTPKDSQVTKTYSVSFVVAKSGLYSQTIKTNFQQLLILSPRGWLDTDYETTTLPAVSGTIDAKSAVNGQIYKLPLVNGVVSLTNQDSYPSGKYTIIDGSNIDTKYTNSDGLIREIPFTLAADDNSSTDPETFTIPSSQPSNPLTLDIDFKLAEDCSPTIIASIQVCEEYPSKLVGEADLRAAASRVSQFAGPIVAKMKGASFAPYPANNLNYIYLGPAWSDKAVAFFSASTNPKSINIVTDYSDRNTSSQAYYDATVGGVDFINTVAHEIFHLLDWEYSKTVGGSLIATNIAYVNSVNTQIANSGGGTYWNELDYPCAYIIASGSLCGGYSAQQLIDVLGSLGLGQQQEAVEAFATEMSSACTWPTQFAANIKNTNLISPASDNATWQTATLQRLALFPQIAVWYKGCLSQ